MMNLMKYILHYFTNNDQQTSYYVLFIFLNHISIMINVLEDQKVRLAPLF